MVPINVGIVIDTLDVFPAHEGVVNSKIVPGKVLRDRAMVNKVVPGIGDIGTMDEDVVNVFR